MSERSCGAEAGRGQRSGGESLGDAGVPEEGRLGRLLDARESPPASSSSEAGKVTVAGKPSERLASQDGGKHPEPSRNQTPMTDFTQQAALYLILIEGGPPSNYSAWSPELPGCAAT